MKRTLRSSAFWLPFFLTLIIAGTFSLWELGLLTDVIPSLQRVPATAFDLLFSAILVLLLSLNAGLVVWQSRHGSCPVGTRSATGIAGIIGAFTLICPVCVLLPASLIGIGFFFTVVAPFLPLLRLISVILLLVSAYMLWPIKKERRLLK